MRLDLACLLSCSLMIVASDSRGAAGAPPAPAPSAKPDAKLRAHPLAFAASPLDNPLKGFIPFYEPTDYPKKLPYSMEWNYFALNDLMKDFDSFDWAPLEKVLDNIGARGNQTALRVYMEYPGKPSAVPEFLKKSGVAMRKVAQWNVESPDYDDRRTIRALTGFVKAFGAKYDGDPRIGFITMGLVGLWGEWHLWPQDALFPKDANVTQYIDAFDAAFDKTQLEIRYADLAGGYPIKKNMGFHDDSFFQRENGKGVTLPQSMGGWEWSFLEKIIRHGGENRWISQSIGGEVRPEVQSSLLRGGPTIDDLKDCVEMTHVTWLMNQKGVVRYEKDDPKLSDLVRTMGYELTVKTAYFDDEIATYAPLKVGVVIENEGVAPFYYPWQVALGVVDTKNQVVKSWNVPWDITKVLPKQIRTFPEWNVAGKPKYLPFGPTQYFENTVAVIGLPAGTYTLVMRVVNPLEYKRAAKSAPPHPLRFANETQTPNGWLKLGELKIKG